MCKCTPSIRTPFCGKKGCEWPKLEDTLSSCPFNCGATKAPELQMSIAGTWREHYVWCQNCGAEGPHMGKQSDAVAAWNRRATQRESGGESVSVPQSMRELLRYRLCASYNDSYFTEPAGLVKRAMADMERALSASQRKECE